MSCPRAIFEAAKFWATIITFAAIFGAILFGVCLVIAYLFVYHIFVLCGVGLILTFIASVVLNKKDGSFTL